MDWGQGTEQRQRCSLETDGAAGILRATVAGFEEELNQVASGAAWGDGRTAGGG